jgi:hypothetical protein
VAGMGERKGANRVLVGQCEGMRPHGRSRRRWKDNINNGPTEIGYEGAA